MEEEDYELYDILVNVKRQLQVKYFDYIDNRKPIICTDDSLRWIAKYKPTTVNDFRNIKGIGDNFIDNYANYFLVKIKQFLDEDCIRINDLEKDILSKLENRLVNINKKNRLLYSGKVNKNYGLDIFKYITNISEFERFILWRNLNSFKVMDIVDFEDDKLKVILNLIRQVCKNEKETGNNELYIAYPFVQGKMEADDFIVKAPLILFPVRLDRTANSINLYNDMTRDVIYNTTLILGNNKCNKKNEVLPKNAIENFQEVSYIDDMINFYNKNGFYVNYENCEIEEFFENLSSEFPSYKNGELEVKKYMVLGIYSAFVTSMYEDFHEMIEEGAVTQLVKDLLVGVDNTIEDKLVFNDEIVAENLIIEDEISYMNELDFSQENVLNQINHYDSIVVQGPPGTGKSQTITSVIVQSILQGKKVLMVSEKKTALDVIYSRLGELSQFSILIEDVLNKESFYNQLNKMISLMSVNKNLPINTLNTKLQIEEEIEGKIEIINRSIDYFEQIFIKVYSNNEFGTSMYNVYNVCKRFDFSNVLEYEEYNLINGMLSEDVFIMKFPILTKVKDFYSDGSNFSSIDFYLSKLKKSPFISNIRADLIDIEVLEFTNDINKLVNDIECYQKLSFYKKLFFYGKLKSLGIGIIDKYLIVDKKFKIKDIIANAGCIKEFLPFYKEFFANKFIYNNLDDAEVKYGKILIEIRDKLEINFLEVNELIYNVVLFNIICQFEKSNVDISNYINNFDNIRIELGKNIAMKKELTKKLAYVQLLSDLTSLNGNNKLNKIEEMCNKKRQQSINAFMSKYNLELLDSVKIWLMTPEVVSEILPFSKNYFDLVIFDEASQLYVEKAIPAIYRAKKVFVAGDDKQLKPSSLGKGRIMDEEEELVKDDVLEYESLLDASRYKYKHTMLNYHYRSKYEELIAFSNYAFYDGKLMVTSMALDCFENPIERIKVENGLWIDKKNKEEAKGVINLLKKIFGERKNNETIGVITFNTTQMNLIEDLIEKERLNDSEFDNLMKLEENRIFDGENISFFVKNIESVQGDERDIIIFCIGYAKNEKGVVAVNFGWLNQDGGENRLNVAISRAKQKIYVITSIEPSELKVENTKNSGPKLFKKYLEYVKAISDGDNLKVQSILMSLSDKKMDVEQLNYDNNIIDEVYSNLIGQGYNVICHYGVGGYKIDLVIQSDDGINLLGIECDGKLYNVFKSSRERDYHRLKYLESRGFNIYRIWSNNWWKNPDLEISKIIKYLDSLDKKI